MADPTIRAVASDKGGGITTMTSTKPVGTAEGDWMFQGHSIRASYSITSVPSGWTLVTSIDAGGSSDPYILVYEKVAGASEPTTYSWSRSTAAGDWIMGGCSVQDADTAGSLIIATPKDTGTGTSHASNGLTALSGDLLLGWYGSFHSSTNVTWTPPTSMTEQVDLHRASGSTVKLSIHLASQASLSAGATGAKTATASTSASGGALLFSIPAVSVSGTIVPFSARHFL